MFPLPTQHCEEPHESKYPTRCAHACRLRKEHEAAEATAQCAEQPERQENVAIGGPFNEQREHDPVVGVDRVAEAELAVAPAAPAAFQPNPWTKRTARAALIPLMRT